MLYRPINSPFFKQLEKCQNQYFHDNLNLISFCPRTSLHVPHFSTKKESVIILKMTNFWRINLAIFHDIKKVEIYFPYGAFVSRIYKDGIKNIFNKNWRIFRIAKIKHSNSNFYEGLYYMEINNRYIIWTKELKI